MPLRVTLLTTSLDRGGAEKQVVSLARSLKERGVAVNVISMLPPVAYAEDLAEAGIAIATLGMRRGIADPKAIWDLAGLLRNYRTEVLHSHMVGANLLARIAGVLVRPAVIVSTAHNINEGPRWRELAYRLTDPLSDLTTNVSMAGVSRYIDVKATPARKMMFMPNGVEPFSPGLDIGEREQLKSSLGCGSSWIWLAVGNLRKAKDYPNLLRAVAQLPADSPDPRILVVGSGEEHEALNRLRQQLRLEDRVQFLGMRSDVTRLLEIADGFVMSSAWEGLPLALIEASFAEVPIVATDVGGNREIVKHGVNGWLVPPFNPAALRDAMIKLQKTPFDERAAMGRAGRAFALDNFSMPKIADRWIDIYSGLLRSHSARKHRPVQR